jgi:hypothetical protein
MRRRWLTAIIVGLLCGLAWPILTFLIFVGVLWLSQTLLPARVPGRGFVAYNLFNPLSYLIDVVVAAIGTWLLLWARERGSRSAALCLAGVASGIVVGALAVADPVALLEKGVTAPFYVELVVTGMIVGALCGLAVALWVSLRPSPRPSP